MTIYGHHSLNPNRLINELNLLLIERCEQVEILKAVNGQPFNLFRFADEEILTRPLFLSYAFSWVPYSEKGNEEGNVGEIVTARKKYHENAAIRDSRYHSLELRIARPIALNGKLTIPMSKVKIYAEPNSSSGIPLFLREDYVGRFPFRRRTTSKKGPTQLEKLLPTEWFFEEV